MMTEAKGASYKATMKFVVTVCWNAHLPQTQMHSWFLKSSKNLRGSRLRGWLLWAWFCDAKQITPELMKTHERPDFLYADFLQWMEDTNVAQHLRKDAMPAVQDLFDVARRDARLSDSTFVRTTRRNTNAQVKTAPKDTEIWDLRIFTQYARDCPDPTKQPWPHLRGLIAAIFMVFVPCRPCAMVRLDTANAKVREKDGAYIVPAQEKTDFGRGVTELIFRHTSEQRLSAGYYYDIAEARALGLGVEDALFCSDKGEKYTQPDVIGKSLVELLHRMGVFGYTGYSFRHAMIQALFDAGLDEKQVNAYTGHSNNSHTALNYYYHLDKAWAGQKLRALPTDRVPLSAAAARVILAEGSEDE
jgi:integrase